MECSNLGPLNVLCDAIEAKSRRLLRPNEMRSMFVDLFSAIYYLHNNQIAHNDVHYRNVLLFDNANRDGIVLKLCDFGNAMRVADADGFAFDLNCMGEVFQSILDCTSFGDDAIAFGEECNDLQYELQAGHYGSSDEVKQLHPWILPITDVQSGTELRTSSLKTMGI